MNIKNRIQKWINPKDSASVTDASLSNAIANKQNPIDNDVNQQLQAAKLNEQEASISPIINKSDETIVQLAIQKPNQKPNVIQVIDNDNTIAHAIEHLTKTNDEQHANQTTVKNEDDASKPDESKTTDDKEPSEAHVEVKATSNDKAKTETKPESKAKDPEKTGKSDAKPAKKAKADKSEKKTKKDKSAKAKKNKKAVDKSETPKADETNNEIKTKADELGEQLSELANRDETFKAQHPDLKIALTILNESNDLNNVFYELNQFKKTTSDPASKQLVKQVKTLYQAQQIQPVINKLYKQVEHHVNELNKNQDKSTEQVQLQFHMLTEDVKTTLKKNQVQKNFYVKDYQERLDTLSSQTPDEIFNTIGGTETKSLWTYLFPKLDLDHNQVSGISEKLVKNYKKDINLTNLIVNISFFEWQLKSNPIKSFNSQAQSQSLLAMLKKTKPSDKPVKIIVKELKNQLKKIIEEHTYGGQTSINWLVDTRLTLEDIVNLTNEDQPDQK